MIERIMMATKKTLSEKQREDLLNTLKDRFEKHTSRHKGLKWADIQKKLEADAGKLWSLHEMERTGGEPDVVGHDKKTGEYLFYDCSPETPEGRKNICYDAKGQAMREKKNIHPSGNAVGMADDMGIELLTEAEYRELQELGEFDLKTSSWIKTPEEIRKLGGALFADRRYNAVFVYHNGAQSFYSSRAFRGVLRV